MNNNLTEFNEGGLHSQNKYGGIPQGLSPDGKMNTTEQGETKKNNYVYSNQLYINEDLVKEMNLPNYIKGKSFANASKSINDKFKDRSDIHSESTKNELLKRLTDAQEYLKQQRDSINESMKLNMSQPNYPENSSFAEGGFMDFVNNNNLLGNIGNQLGSLINSKGYNGKDIEEANNLGFENKHLQNTNGYLQGLDVVENSIGSSFGPIGKGIIGGKKLLEGITSSIGGEGGSIAKSIISPEKSAITNLTDKDLNFGQKALGVLPGIGGLISKRSADKKLNKFTTDKNRADNFYKYQYNENNDETKSFAEGGELFDPPTKVSKNQLVQYASQNNNVNEPSSSKYLDIVGMQKGVLHPKLGNGAYFYSGKTPLDPGFDPVANREFIRQDAIQSYLNSEQGKKYQNALKAQIELEKSSGSPIYSYSYLKPTTSFAEGGDMQYPKNEVDTYLSESRPFPYFDDNYNKAMNPKYSESLVSNLKPKGLNLTYNSNSDLNNINKSNINIKNESNENSMLNNIGNNLLRYSPVIGNIIQKSKMSPAEVEKPIKNSYQYKKQYIDDQSYSNASKNESANTIEALSKSGLSGNQLLSAMLGSELNRTKAVAEGSLNAKLHNINENKIAEKVKENNESDFINDARRINDINAQNRANYDTQKSKFDSAIFSSLGDIGKEQIFKQMAEKMTGYDWMGNYLKLNPNATPEEVDKAYKEEQSKKKTSIVENKYGGLMKLNFKKY